jgi:alkanesulfonate monooxygenase SsuD/methylene tetrahydromethanopterin reductase-like flavin-dependent oxidoreductase (luciferase family)
VAAATSRINIGILVTCLGWRHPSIVAKMAENIDEISKGRFILGVGAGWNEPEYNMFGMPFDRRFARFENALKIIQPFLREGRADYQGEFFQANDALHLPRGPRGAEGGPPIMVGTAGAQTMRLTAAYADAWNSAAAWHQDAASVVPLLKQLDAACEEIGRDPKTLVRTVGSSVALPGALGRRSEPITGEPAQIAEVLAGFRDIGLRHHAAGLDPTTPASLEQYARVIEILDRG